MTSDASGARGSATRARLIRATTELVAEVGYHGATTRVIAERAGVAEGSIYRHFADKRALFSAAVLAGQQGLEQWMTDLPERAGTGSVTANLTEALVQLSRLRSSVIPLEAALAASPELGGVRGSPLATGVDSTDLAAALATRGGPPLMLTRYLQAEQRQGRVAPDIDSVRAAFVLLVTLYGVQTSPLAGPDGVDRSTIEGVVGLFVRGLQPRPDER